MKKVYLVYNVTACCLISVCSNVRVAKKVVDYLEEANSYSSFKCTYNIVTEDLISKF